MEASQASRSMASAMSSFSVVFCLSGHTGSINALAFSPDGLYLASGADDGIIFVFELTAGREVYKLDALAPVTALLWSGEHIYAGFGNGRLLCAKVTDDEFMAYYLPRTGDGIIEFIARDDPTGRLAVCVGPKLEIWTPVQVAQPYVMQESSLPMPHVASSPPEDRIVNSAVESILQSQIRTAHFVDSGHGLLVSYLDNGIYYWDFEARCYLWHIKTRAGRTAVSSDEEFIAVSNLYDGFDLYRLRDRSHLFTIRVNMDINIPLPVLFLDRGGEVLIGSSCGDVTIHQTSTGNIIQGLPHNDDIVQALASWDEPNKTKLLATGVSERGEDTRIRVWRASPPPVHLPSSRMDVGVRPYMRRDIGVETDKCETFSPIISTSRVAVGRESGTDELNRRTQSSWTRRVPVYSVAILAIATILAAILTSYTVPLHSTLGYIARIHMAVLSHIYDFVATARIASLRVLLYVGRGLQEIISRYIDAIDEAL